MLKRGIIQKALNSLSDVEICGEVDIIYKNLLDIAYGFDFVKNNSYEIATNIMQKSPLFTKLILDNLNEYLSQKRTKLLSVPQLCFSWCILSGIGISYLSKTNSKLVDVNSLLNHLWDKKGSNAIDEFVLKEIVIKKGYSPQKVTENIKVISEVALFPMNSVTNRPHSIMNHFFAVNNACFLFGVALEENMIG